MLENVYLGVEEKKFGFLSAKKTTKELEKIISEYNLELDLNERIGDLSYSKRQRVEILKALYRGNDIFIFDKPTEYLTPSEAGNLIRIFKQLSGEGKSIILISDNLSEIKAVADSVTVLKKGKSSGPYKASDLSTDDMFELICGKRQYDLIQKKGVRSESPVLRVDNVSSDVLQNLSLEVCGGEIAGIAATKDSGYKHLVNVLTGIVKTLPGSIFINNADVSALSVRKRMNMGLNTILEDSLKESLMPEASAADNLALNVYYKNPFQKFGFINNSIIKAYSLYLIEKYDISVKNHPNICVGEMTGGNRRKIATVSKLEGKMEALIAVRPGAGMDTLSTEFVYNRLLELRNSGKAVLLISSDINELKLLCDKIYVLDSGKITHCVSPKDASINKIGEMMSV